MQEIERLKKENEALEKRNALLEQAVQQSKVIKNKFNESTKLLKEKDKQLEELNHSLEKKVLGRTKELESEKNYIQHILDINPDIIIVTNGSRLIRGNRSFFDLFHYTDRQEFLREHDCICDFFVTLNNKPFPKNKMVEGKVWAKYLVEHPDENHVAKLKVGENYYFFNVVATRLNSLEILVIFTNITELKKQEEQLLKSEKLASMGEMIGNIAHQWRQPLSIISTAATGMKMKRELGNLEQKEIFEFCEMINDNAQYLSKTIDDFRNFIRGESKPINFNLKNDTDSFIKLVDSSIKKYNIQVILDLEEHINIKGYPSELIQCFMNIFNNSKDAFLENNIPEDQRYIFIRQNIVDNNVIIIFKDNGGGIPENIINKVFDPYFTTKHKSQGTGLGLHMTYNLIVNGMGGVVSAENEEYIFNEKKYKGAKFTIFLKID